MALDVSDMVIIGVAVYYYMKKKREKAAELEGSTTNEEVNTLESTPDEFLATGGSSQKERPSGKAIPKTTVTTVKAFDHVAYAPFTKGLTFQVKGPLSLK